MLSWFKDLVAPLRRHDPRLGALRYLRDARIWEGRTSFRPIGREIELLVRGEDGGPTAVQRMFFDEVENRYESLWPTIKKKLAAEALSVGATAETFELVAVSVPTEPGERAEWELSYESRPRSWHFTVQMEGWRSRDVVAEC